MKLALSTAVKMTGLLALPLVMLSTVGSDVAMAGDRTATDFYCYCGANTAYLRAAVRFEDYGEHVYVKDELRDYDSIYATVYDATTGAYEGEAVSSTAGVWGPDGNFEIAEGHRVRINVYMHDPTHQLPDKYLGYVKRADGQLPRA
ncbi:hypothetical protein DSM104299_05449 [Baekduia alba]|uniref:hypothetical protein n=1 Tax=Baekduia alba TaxID=2997333 RepID=UPI002341FCF1|nr:hypothetical protein [Baekduia alba]WCB96683.1 hypothetical protein DSM104299_05449 [Baekduia alba]